MDNGKSDRCLADASIVYGVNDRPEMTFEQRVNSWRDRDTGRIS
ncbi:MAG: hypothetical protein ACLU30_13890 [Odoribacter splanchnicus]